MSCCGLCTQVWDCQHARYSLVHAVGHCQALLLQGQLRWQVCIHAPCQLSCAELMYGAGSVRSGQLASIHELKGKGQEQYHLEGDD